MQNSNYFYKQLICLFLCKNWKLCFDLQVETQQHAVNMYIQYIIDS